MAKSYSKLYQAQRHYPLTIVLQANTVWLSCSNNNRYILIYMTYWILMFDELVKILQQDYLKNLPLYNTANVHLVKLPKNDGFHYLVSI